MAASVTVTGDAVTIGKPVPLLRVVADAGGYGSTWTSNGDNTRFVLVEAVHGMSQTFHLLTNWQR
jgi:hypothetical protein